MFEEWQICYQACAAYSLVVVSLYETLGPAIVEYCINHSDTRLVLASAIHIPELLTQATNTPGLRVIVCADGWDSLEPVPKSKACSVGQRSQALKVWAKQLGLLLLDINERTFFFHFLLFARIFQDLLTIFFFICCSRSVRPIKPFCSHSTNPFITDLNLLYIWYNWFT